MKTKKMKNKKAGTIIICLLFAAVWVLPTFCNAQTGVAVNTTGATANPSAMLDVSATNLGVLLPNVSLISNTDVVTIANPATSLLVYNTNASMTLGSGKGFYYWDGAQWRAVGGGAAPCSTAPATPGTISGNIAVCTGGIGTYFVAPVTGATSYTWTYTGTGSTISGTTNIVVVSFSSSATSGNLTVTATNACGTSSSSAALSVTVNGTPNSNFTTYPSPVIPGILVTFTPTDNTNQLYFWQTPDATINSTAMNPTLTMGSTYGNIALTVTKSGCNSTTVVSELNAKIYKFTSSTTWTAPVGVTSVAVLVVAGGGSGGNSTTTNGNGGGGSGGVIENMAYSVTPGNTYTVTIGAGGTRIANRTCAVGNNGGNSVFATLTAIGGGGGGSTCCCSGQNGGSGGGGARNNPTPGSSTQTGGYGNSGAGSTCSWTGGGGGGAGSVGVAGDYPSCGTAPAGNGGSGYKSNITGLKYAGGGGGGGNSSERAGDGYDGGGRGCGTTSYYDSYTYPAQVVNSITGGSSTPDAIANTGGGGGGGSYWADNGGWNNGSGQGGSGIVILRY